MKFRLVTLNKRDENFKNEVGAVLLLVFIASLIISVGALSLAMRGGESNNDETNDMYISATESVSIADFNSSNEDVKKMALITYSVKSIYKQFENYFGEDVTMKCYYNEDENAVKIYFNMYTDLVTEIDEAKLVNNMIPTMSVVQSISQETLDMNLNLHLSDSQTPMVKIYITSSHDDEILFEL